MAAKNLNAKIGRTYVPATPQITSLQVRMAAQDIGNWKTAIDNARNVTMPRRRKLYELYDIIGLDGHLISVMNKRKISITNQKVHFNLKGQDGVVDEKVRDLITETPWFYKLVGHLVESKPYGHSLVELVPKMGFIGDVQLVPRANVKPEAGFVMWDTNNESNGFAWREDPTYGKYMMEMGAPKDYGLLMTAAQYVIYKRGAFGDWAQFAELFGMPFREGQYKPWDEEGRIKLEDALSKMGGAGWVVTPEGTDLKFHDNNGAGKSEVFKDLIDMCNAEMSKILLGNTMTTDNGSSRSQGEVHKEVENDINLADMIELEYLLNWELSDKLREIGYPVPEGRFFYPQMQDVPLETRIDMDMKLSSKIAIAPEYWYNTYGIPKPDDGVLVVTTEPLADPKEADPVADPKAADKKKAPAVTAMYNANCGCQPDAPIVTAVGEDLTAAENELLQELFNGHAGKYDAATMQGTISKLRSAIFTHLPPTAEYGTDDHLASTMMEANVNRFGFDKNLATVYKLNQMLDNNETFGQFKAKANILLKQYNHAHLQTEYDFAISAAQNAANWNRQKQQAGLFPYLKYMTAGDSHVRAAHAALDGKLFKVLDTSWRGIYPPNGWNCRCEMVQIDKESANEADIIDGPTANGLLGEEYTKMQKGGFDKNRGDLNQVFELNKAYIKQLPAKYRVNTDTLSYADAGLQTIAEIAAKAPAMPAVVNTTTVAQVSESFAAAAKLYKQEMSMFYKDYAGRNIRLGQGVLEEHLNGHYITPEENRQGLFRILAECVSNPTEVYMQEYKLKTFQYRFIKIYKDKAMVVDARFEGDGLVVKTWYELKADEAMVRSGILIKN